MDRPRTLYVRNVPDRLLRAARAAAARDGITLGALVIRALERQTGTAGAEDPLADDVRWFEGHRDELVEAFGGEYIAVVGGRVVDHDADFDALARRVFARNEGRSVFLPRVDAPRRVVSLRSPRRA